MIAFFDKKICLFFTHVCRRVKNKSAGKNDRLNLQKNNIITTGSFSSTFHFLCLAGLLFQKAPVLFYGDQ